MKNTREKATLQRESLTIEKAFDWCWDQIDGADPIDGPWARISQGPLTRQPKGE